MSPEKIGRYEIIGTLGKGAMGVVYKAVDPTIGRTVALKTTRLDIHGTDAEELLARFRNEARLAGVLNHPNIVTVYDAGEFEGLFYIAMEFIEGQTLHQTLAGKKPLPIEQVIAITRQICAGLDAAAAHKVVHRDIKPANIMLEANGTAKIMDFGIAKSGGGLTSTGQVLGTPNYMSPEQVRGKPLDGRSDLFSLGVILYEMVTGAKPFTGDNVTTIIYKILNEDPPAPRESNVSIHPGLDTVVTKALEKNPALRYQTGAEFAAALGRYKQSTLGDEPTTRIPAATIATTGAAAAVAAKPARATPSRSAIARIASEKSNRWLFASAAVLLAITAATGIGIYVRHWRAQQQRTELDRLLTASNPATTPSNNPAAAPAESTSSEKPSPASPAGAPEATTTGAAQLVLNTNPEGAQIKIDGRNDPDWKTPYTSSIEPGSHTVAFALEGYASETRTVNVSPGTQAYVAATLKVVSAAPLPTGTVQLNTEPDGAEIFVDGQSAGKTTPASLALSEGEHNLIFRKSGYGELSTSLRVQGRQSYTVSNKLQPASSNLSRLRNLFSSGSKVPVQVRTTPKGAQVIINGVLQSRTTTFKTSLEPGSYDIKLQLEGYKPLDKTITVEKSTPLEIDEVLEKQQ